MDDPAAPQQNPIVAMATRLRARKDLGAAIDSLETSAAPSAPAADGDALLAAFGAALEDGARRLGAILGRSALKVVRLERPRRIRVRFAEERISLDHDRVRELVVVAGCGLDGEYQFDVAASAPTLINLSRLSTEAGYGEPLTPGRVLKRIAQDAEIPPPPHLNGPGPLSF